MITRQYLDINLSNQTVKAEELSDLDLVKAGRHLIVRKLLEMGSAKIDPMSAENPLIFSAGPLAGTTFSNANRLSVGCKSPMTGGIKEANAGGTLAYAMGRVGIAGFTLHGQAEDWVIIHIDKEANFSFLDAAELLELDNFEAANYLFDKYGKKISFALCGPIGAYGGLLGGIAVSDTDGRPSRMAARGGVGAVMGNKKVKAIVIELHSMPELHDRKKTLGAVKQYGKWMRENDIIVGGYTEMGTMGTGDYVNHVGGIPVNNFTSGTAPNNDDGEFALGGTFVRALNLSRGGQQSHACMPGCIIQCSNVYADENGDEVVSPVEYETLGVLGTNCGLTHPDNLAQMNYLCNALGIDTIETGATIALLMDVGLAEFGDVDFMQRFFQALQDGTEEGKLWAKGVYQVGKHYDHHRIPAIKKQAISAYDPRIIEVTGVSMMSTAQGADHTTGNVPKMKTSDKDLGELMQISLESQIACAASDSIGLCVFGRFVTNPKVDFMAQSINDALGTNLSPNFFYEIGKEVLKMERDFNLAAGFTQDDDDLPEFFYDEQLPPTQRTARFRGKDVHEIYALMDEVGAEMVPEEFVR